MRLHRLEVEGFGPFRERHAVDFDAFHADGLFLITGRTGAGKSSVLDAVCFALYGGVPRYDGAEKRLRSDHCAPDESTRVLLEFTAGDRRWRVARSPEYERPKLRGDGLTVEPHRAQLDEYVDGAWVGRAARPVDVGVVLDDIVGLNQQQFLQVILLAQNRFARFLLAKNDDRQALLRTLFGTRRFEQYEAELDRRRKSADQALAAATEGVHVRLDEAARLIAEYDLAGVDEAPGAHDRGARLDAAGRALARARYRVDTAKRARSDAEHAQLQAVASHARVLDDARRQAERDATRAALAALEAQAGAIADTRDRIERAVHAEGLRAPLETAARAAARAADERNRADAAAAAYLAADGDPAMAGDAEALTHLVDELARELGAADAAADRERELEQAALERKTLHAQVSALDEACARVDERRRTLPLAIAEAEDQARSAAATAALAPGAESALAAARERRDAGHAAAALQAHADAADATLLECGIALQQASAAVTALLRERLRGAAAELAARLVDGDPCAVCGSVEHPAPAAAAHEPVTDARVAAAEAVKDAAVLAERDASAVARTVREQLAAARARAGADDLVALDSAVSEAERARDAARAAADAEATAIMLIDRLRAEADTLETAHRAAVVELGDARAALDALTAREASARAAVDAARGAFPSVRALIADIGRRRKAARQLLTDLTAAAAADAAAAAASVDLNDRVARSDFADAASAHQALLPAGERETLARGVAEYDGALVAARATLLPLELAALPEEPIDVSAADAALAEAQARRDAAVAEATGAAHVAARLSELVDRAVDAAADIGAAEDDRAVVARLADTFAGRAPNTHRMTLETFVLAAELEEIVIAANVRLSEMSSGRYRLQHTDALAARGAASGLGLEILDAFTGRARPAASLSGGETFLASLALALGLAEVVTARAGGVRLDTLFVDEGFGQLDAETLEIAMRTLDDLRQGGRTVGVISHVEAMKDQIPAQLAVEATGRGDSRIRQGLAAPV